MIKHIFFLSLLTLLLSCEKNELSDKNTNGKSYIIVGQYDNEHQSYFDITPDFELPFTEVDCQTYKSKDSIDITDDGECDLILQYNMNNDLQGNCDTNDIAWGAKVHLSKKIEIINNKLQFHSILDCIIPLEKNDTIHPNLSWNSSNKLIITSINYKNEGSGYWSWTPVNDKYLGLKFSENDSYKYGWIRINADKTIAFKDFAWNLEFEIKE